MLTEIRLIFIVDCYQIKCNTYRAKHIRYYLICLCKVTRQMEMLKVTSPSYWRCREVREISSFRMQLKILHLFQIAKQLSYPS